jgi:hypothetical protein
VLDSANPICGTWLATPLWLKAGGKMHTMANRSGHRWNVSAGAIILLLLLSAGCDRSQPVQSADAAANPDQGPPFHGTTNQSSSSGAPALAESTESAHVPFQEPPVHMLPAGTLMTVQLKSALSGAKLHPGDSFVAVVAAPVSVGGEKLIDRGAAVLGRVEAIRSMHDRSGLVPSSGYIRMSLNAVTVGGRPIPLQTSSLFARGTLHSGSVRIPKGRDLTFRLTSTVALEEANPSSDRSHPLGTE